MWLLLMCFELLKGISRNMIIIICNYLVLWEGKYKEMTKCNIHAEVLPADDSPEGSKTELPSITIETPTEEGTPVKKKRESKAFLPPSAKPKSDKVLPDAGVEFKSYVHRKKGIKGWEKTYAVLTYQALYFTTIEDNKEYSNIIHLSADGSCTVSQKKGHDKHSQTLVIKAGKKSEHISVEAGTEFSRWKQALDRVMGTGEMVGELLSEDEEIMEGIIIMLIIYVKAVLTVKPWST